MRDFKGMKRQRGRNRGGSSGGGKPQHNTNRAFDSNGPDGIKVRGAAQSVYEKYQQLARDAQTAGDRVLAENYLQHAEHYFRLLRAMQPLRPLAEILGRDQFVSGYDIDFEDESAAGEPQEGDAPEMLNGGQADRTGRPVESRGGDERATDARQGEARSIDARPTDGRQADGRQNESRRSDFRNDEPRDDARRDARPRHEDRYRDDRRRDDRRPARDERLEQAGSPRDPLAVVEPRSAPLASAGTGPVETFVPSLLRADDGDVSHAPAFLSVRPVEPRAEPGEDEGGSVRADSRPPRRRRSTSERAAAPEEV